MDTAVSTVKPESFSIDHTHMPAPNVRKAGNSVGPKGDMVSKFDLRFMKPNTDTIPTAAMHTLEHLLATYMRNYLDGIIDLSPMGCRTGFYLSIWGEVDSAAVTDALRKSLKDILITAWSEVPGISERECGNWRDHSLFAAQEYARQVLRGLENA
jgi:S-ribosylhomocysteine lyase